MPFYEGLCTIKRGGVFHPPGTIHEFDETDARALGVGRLRPITDAVAAEPRLAPESSGAAPLADEPPGADAPADEPGGSSLSDAPPPAGEGTSRVAEIKEAIDLLDENDDFVHTGHRKGLPKKKPLSDILGYEAEDDEIEAALKLREEM